MDEILKLLLRCPEVRKVIKTGLVPWHVFVVSHLAGAGKVAWAECPGKRRKLTALSISHEAAGSIYLLSLLGEMCQSFSTRMQK